VGPWHFSISFKRIDHFIFQFLAKIKVCLGRKIVSLKTFHFETRSSWHFSKVPYDKSCIVHMIDFGFSSPIMQVKIFILSPIVVRDLNRIKEERTAGAKSKILLIPVT